MQLSALNAAELVGNIRKLVPKERYFLIVLNAVEKMGNTVKDVLYTIVT